MFRILLLRFAALALPAILLPVILQAQPAWWHSGGLGGGGNGTYNYLTQPVISPHNPNDIILSTAADMLYRTTDFGRSWAPMNIHRIRTSGSGTAARIAFAGTQGTLFATSYAGGSSRVVKSTDNGESWEDQETDPTEGEAGFMAADPANDQRLVVAGGAGYYYTWDGGKTFVLRYNRQSPPNVVGSFFSGNAIYLATSSGMMATYDPQWTSFKVYNVPGIPTRAVNSMAAGRQGDTVRLFYITTFSELITVDPTEWAWKGKRLTAPTGFTPNVAGMARNNISILYLAGRATATGRVMVYRSTNAGTTWDTVFFTANNRNVRTGWAGDQGDYDWPTNRPVNLAVAPGDPGKAVLVNGGFVYTTSDTGRTWQQAYTDSANSNPANAPTSKGRAYTGTGIELTTVWDLAWADSAHMFAAYTDYRGTFSTDGGTSWSLGHTGLVEGSTYHVAVDKVTGTLYGATSTLRDLHYSEIFYNNNIDTAGGRVVVSTDKGRTWATLRNFRHPVTWVMVDPRQRNRVYACVAHSTDGGIYVSNDVDKGTNSSWTKLSNPLGTAGRPFNLHMLKDGALVATYAGRYDNGFTYTSGVYISTNDGASWDSRTAAQMQYWTTDITIDPNDPAQNTWYVCVYGGSDDRGDFAGVYRTTDRGRTWKRILALDATSSCTVNPGNPNEMYVTTGTYGLWYSSNVLADEPAFLPVESYRYPSPRRVFFDPYFPTRIWVLSTGNGIGYFLTVPPPTLPELLSPTNGTGGAPTDVAFYWRSVPTATRYRLQVAKTRDFSTIVLDTTGVPVTEAAFNGLAMSTTYYWRVAATNDAGSGPWSEVWSFTTVAPEALGVPLLQAPQDDTTDMRQPYMFTWRAVPQAMQYQIQISRDITISDIVHDVWKNTPDTTEMISGLDVGTRYYWHVRAASPTDTSDWSPVWRFTTEFVSGVGTAAGAQAASIRVMSSGALQTMVPIEITLPRAGAPLLAVTDSRGSLITTITPGTLDAGTHMLQWNTAGLPSGMYFCRLAFEGSTSTARVMVVR